jgi:hypothetical protein
MTRHGNLEFRMKVGRTTLGLICPSTDYAESMAKYFQTTASTAEPDLRLKLEIVDHDGPTRLPNNLFTTKSLTANGFTIADDLISGSYDPESRSGVVRVKGLLTKGHYTRIFEQFLYQAFYTARNAANYDAFLIHSSGVIRELGGERDGFLFVGASEAGKSTIASLSPDRIVTNDEMNLIEFSPTGPILQATPFNGLFTAKETEAKAPLRAILLLDKGSEHRLGEVNSSEAITLLASQIAPPVGLEQAMEQTIGLELLELAHRLSEAAPVMKMTFLPNVGFWSEIDTVFQPLKSSN